MKRIEHYFYWFLLPENKMHFYDSYRRQLAKKKKNQKRRRQKWLFLDDMTQYWVMVYQTHNGLLAYYGLIF